MIEESKYPKDKVLIFCDDCEKYSESEKDFISCQYCGNVNTWRFGGWEFK